MRTCQDYSNKMCENTSPILSLWLPRGQKTRDATGLTPKMGFSAKTMQCTQWNWRRNPPAMPPSSILPPTFLSPLAGLKVVRQIGFCRLSLSLSLSGRTFLSRTRSISTPGNQESILSCNVCLWTGIVKYVQSPG